MKSLLVPLWLRLYDDCCRVGSYPGTTRDKKTILSRVESEGLSFLTITLPSFCKDFERSLEEGRVDPAAFRAFRKAGPIPAFLQGMTDRIFDQYGILRENVDIQAIGHIRQLTNVFKKLKAECTPEREQAALDAYADVERELGQLRVPEHLLYRFEQVCRVLWKDFEINTLDLRPQFGPGVTADKLSQFERREHTYWPKRLDTMFPFYGTAFAVGSYLEDQCVLLDEDLEQPVRVILVPKTLKSPRVIAAEPAAMQFCQQALLDHLDQRIEGCYKQFLSMRDQTRNQRLTSDLSLATLDLKEASDRCHGALVYLMLSSCPSLRDASFACRSTKAELPDGRVFILQKFASMGSALCFPMETMLFFSIVVMEILGNRPIRAVPTVLKELTGKCSIFGDDIIVPKEYASDIVRKLETFGLRVNKDKSFLNGKFRESCGRDAYDGVDVTPLYCRHDPMSDTPESIVSMVHLANKFYQRGLVDTAEFIKQHTPFIKAYVPDERFVGWTFGGSPKFRYNKTLQRREFVTHVGVARTQYVRNDNWAGLSDWFHRSLRSYDTKQIRARSKDTFLKIKKVWTPHYM